MLRKMTAQKSKAPYNVMGEQRKYPYDVTMKYTHPKILQLKQSKHANFDFMIHNTFLTLQ